MLRRLELAGFKNFRKTALELGPFTLLVGANASGKSNLRDAFRFLHGISRGYTLAEIIGEKWIEGGVLQWRGIRGGTREICFDAAHCFELAAQFDVPGAGGASSYSRKATYTIRVEPSLERQRPAVTLERLKVGSWERVFDTDPDGGDPVSDHNEPNQISVRMRKGGGQKKFGHRMNLIDSMPVLTQVVDHSDPKLLKSIREDAKQAIHAFEGMRFLDLSTEAMRKPSVPGQTILGDQGENLSSVLQAICEDSDRKATLLDWIRELTPMDAADFDFPSDAEGRILLALVEASGQRISAHSASDGTLRFLAVIAALLGPRPAAFYFFEEIDNGIHPTRLHLLLQLIEQEVAKEKVQIVATTHSPDLLALLGPDSLEYASLVYRLPDAQEGRIRRILDIPGAVDLIEKQDPRRLYASGWFEDAVAFTDADTAA